MINMHKMGNTNTFKVKRFIPTDNRDVTNLQLLYCPITILYCCKEMPIGKIQYIVCTVCSRQQPIYYTISKTVHEKHCKDR